MSRERDLEDEYIGFQVDFLCLELTEKGLPCHSDDPCSNTSKVGGLYSMYYCAGTFLMEHNPKSTRGVGGCFFEIFEKYHGTFFVPKKKRGTPKQWVNRLVPHYEKQKRYCNKQ